MEESSEGVMISSDESDDDVVIWPAEPALPTPLMGLKGPKEETEDDRTLKTEAHINLKTINNSQLLTGDCRGDLRMNNIQTSARINLVACSLQSKRIILAGTVTLLIAYSCFCYFELPYLKASLVVIAAMFLSKVVLAG
nr:midasin-like isoform X4 [Ipomoea batatas]